MPSFVKISIAFAIIAFANASRLKPATTLEKRKKGSSKKGSRKKGSKTKTHYDGIIAPDQHTIIYPPVYGGTNPPEGPEGNAVNPSAAAISQSSTGGASDDESLMNIDNDFLINNEENIALTEENIALKACHSIGILALFIF